MWVQGGYTPGQQQHEQDGHLMCGIFGLVRAQGASRAAISRGTRALLMLGNFSDERGRDSAGLALMNAERERYETTTPMLVDLRTQAVDMDGVLVIKGKVAFKDLNFSRTEMTEVTNSDIILGHTRSATQGSPSDLANASPMLVGALVGTHNGDIDTTTVTLPRMVARACLGSTDTEYLYQALNLARFDRRRIVDVLTRMRGRAALAWVDRGRTDRLYLARQALSPLAIAIDNDGNFYYASNPDWFRKISETHHDINFQAIMLVPEGHLLTVDTFTGQVTDVRKFQGTVREHDIRLTNSAVYRGFLSDDKAIDMTLHNHRVTAPHRIGEQGTVTQIPTSLIPVTGAVNVTQPVKPKKTTPDAGASATKALSATTLAQVEHGARNANGILTKVAQAVIEYCTDETTGLVDDVLVEEMLFDFTDMSDRQQIEYLNGMRAMSGVGPITL